MITPWLEGIERELRYFEIKSDLDKKDALIIYGGPEIAILEKSLPDPTDKPGYAGDDENLNAYTRLKWKVSDFYSKKNTHHAKFIFSSMKPSVLSSGKVESTVSYAARLREQASNCDYHNPDDRILEHLILTIDKKELIRKAISKKWNLAKFLKEAAEMEDIDCQLTEMKSREEKEVARVMKHKSFKKKTWQAKIF